MQFITTIGSILGWSLLSIILAAVISILVVKIVLGVKVSHLIAEIEERQNAAVGIIFKDIAAGLSGLLLIFTFAGLTPSTGLLGDILWTLGAGLITLVFIGVLAFLLLRWLAGRHPLKESPLQYLRRELVEEKNEALAHIIMAFLIVIGITIIGQIL
ncbi:MAG TPA: hypothetical protein VKR06_05110 [Ktedonosporobacter sp.]|nr:hypothetical protein [Ktedonosporobacter sp.]